ncbi:MAG: hypothetical protein IKB56_05485 [Clostridia bacterium]|nr:hypothetical protein [Clostridia bacterium]
MKQKTTLIIITCLLTASLVLAIGTVTFSWYQSRLSSDQGMTIPADGFLIVGFDENPEVAVGTLAPAIAKENAVRDNKYFDVKQLYNESDENPSWIEKEAQEYTHTEVITFYEDPTNENIQSYKFLLTAQAFVKQGESETKYNINTNREIVFDISALVDYTDLEDPASPIDITLGTPFYIDGSAKITLTITMWLALPDELCDPMLISNDLYCEFGIKAEAVTQ